MFPCSKAMTSNVTSIFFFGQVTCDNGIIVSPEIEIKCEGKLMRPYSVSMPTCYFSIDDDNSAQITVGI